MIDISKLWNELMKYLTDDRINSLNEATNADS